MQAKMPEKNSCKPTLKKTFLAEEDFTKVKFLWIT